MSQFNGEQREGEFSLPLHFGPIQPLGGFSEAPPPH